MSDLSPTLDSLLRLGFQRRVDGFGEPTVSYRFPALDLLASDCINRAFVPVVLLSGVLSTGRVIANIHSELPRNLGTPAIAAAWVSYALKSHRSELVPLPEWMLDGERNWDALPFVRSQREYEARPRCLIDREHARLLRRSLTEALSQLSRESVMTFHFDGRVLSVRVDGRSFATIATGDPWQSNYEISVTSETKLPARFISEDVEISFFDGAVRFDRYRYDAWEAKG